MMATTDLADNRAGSQGLDGALTVYALVDGGNKIIAPGRNAAA